MKQSPFVLGALILLSACSGGSRRGAQGPDAPSQEVAVNTPTTGSTSTNTDHPTGTTDIDTPLQVEIHEANYYDAEGLARLEKARLLLERVVNGEEFQQSVLNHTYQGKKQFVQNDGLSNLEIYQKLRLGAEQFPRVTDVDHSMDLRLELYTSTWENRTVIGYTNPRTSMVFMNTYFFEKAQTADLAGNMIHEWLHKLGFGHDYEVTTRRPHSVPYAVGYIVRDLVKKLQ